MNKIVEETKNRELSDLNTEKLFALFFKAKEELDKVPTTATFEAEEASLESMKTYWKI